MRYDVKAGAFAPYLGGISATDVKVSPDGQWAAYAAYPDRTLWRCKIDGSEKQQLTFAPSFAARPSWSHDGKQIAWTEVVPGKQPAMYVMDPGGGTGFSWSPDGKSGVFNLSGAANSAAVRGASDVVAIIDLTSQTTSILPESKGMLGPEWSPDGRYILAKASDEHRVMLFDMSVQSWIGLARADLVTNVRWSRDGQLVYFEQVTPHDSALLRVRLADRKFERVMDFRTIRRPLVTLSSAWSGFTDDGAPLLQRDIGSQEIYRLEWKLP